MPYKYAPSTRNVGKRQAVVNQPYVTNNLGKLAHYIFQIARDVATKEADLATRMAQHRAPLRKVFTGGRATIGPKTLTVKEIKTIRARMRYANWGFRDEETGKGMPVQMISNRYVTHPNRKNTYARSWNLREVLETRAPSGPEFHLASRWQEENRLNSEGRYALKMAKIRDIKGDVIDVGRGAIYAEVVERDGKEAIVYHLGGNLRASIHTRDDTKRKILVSVVAGGQRAPYAKFMEFGTRYVAARPFLRPALKHVEHRYGADMFKALDKAFPGRVRRG